MAAPAMTPNAAARSSPRASSAVATLTGSSANRRRASAHSPVPPACTQLRGRGSPIVMCRQQSGRVSSGFETSGEQADHRWRLRAGRLRRPLGACRARSPGSKHGPQSEPARDAHDDGEDDQQGPPPPNACGSRRYACIRPRRRSPRSCTGKLAAIIGDTRDADNRLNTRAHDARPPVPSRVTAARGRCAGRDLVGGAGNTVRNSRRYGRSWTGSCPGRARLR